MDDEKSVGLADLGVELILKHTCFFVFSICFSSRFVSSVLLSSLFLSSTTVFQKTAFSDSASAIRRQREVESSGWAEKEGLICSR